LKILLTLESGINAINEHIGRTVAWLAMVMVLVQFAIVILRYVFGIGSLFVQESMVYMFAVLFMASAGYTLRHDGHVRVDIFYRTASAKQKALVDLVGVVICLFPICLLIWIMSWPYVSASWAVFEGSRETSGIQAVFLLKSLIPMFAILLGLQGLALAIRSGLFLLGIAKPDPADVDHTDGAV
jgi:TRAP-type mannitol/chloroaromatic compound transport system permease small subunit